VMNPLTVILSAAKNLLL